MNIRSVKKFSYYSSFSPALLALIYIAFCGVASFLVFTYQNDASFAIIFYTFLLLFGMIFSAEAYVRELKKVIRKCFHEANPPPNLAAEFNKPESLHKRIQEIGSVFAEIAAASGIVLFGLSVIRPYSESVRATKLEVIRTEYSQVATLAGSRFLDFCFIEPAAFRALSEFSKKTCDLLGNFDTRDAEKSTLEPKFRAFADALPSKSVEDRQIKTAVTELADKILSIDKMPSIVDAREELQAMSTLPQFTSRLAWLPLCGGFALCLATALKLGRAFAETTEIRAGNFGGIDISKPVDSQTGQVSLDTSAQPSLALPALKESQSDPLATKRPE